MDSKSIGLCPRRLESCRCRGCRNTGCSWTVLRMPWLTNPLDSAAAGRKPASWGGSRPIILTAIRTQGSANRRQRVRVVKEMDQKSIGLCPRRLESCRCRKCLGRSKPQMLMYECAGAKQKTTCPRNPAYHQTHHSPYPHNPQHHPPYRTQYHPPHRLLYQLPIPPTRPPSYCAQYHTPLQPPYHPPHQPPYIAQ